MKIVKCNTGHYFDVDKSPVCPACGQPAENVSKNYSNETMHTKQKNDVAPDHIKNSGTQSVPATVNGKKRTLIVLLIALFAIIVFAVCVIIGFILFSRMNNNDSNNDNSIRGEFATEKHTIPNLTDASEYNTFAVYNENDLNAMLSNIKDGDSFEIYHAVLSYDSGEFALAYDRSSPYSLALTAEKFDLLHYNKYVVSLTGVYDGQYNVDSVRTDKKIIDNQEGLIDFADIQSHRYEESASVIKCKVFYDDIALNEYCIRFDDMNYGYMIISDGKTDLSAYKGKTVDCTITIKENTANYGGAYATKDYWELNSIDHVY